MKFEVGDRVVHYLHGPGIITQMDEKVLNGHKKLYYAVQIGDFTLYIPAEETENHSLRLPTPAVEFDNLFDILRGPGEPLSVDRLQRKIDLNERMRDGKLESVCRVIRDLAYHGKTAKMNENDTVIMERAQRFLLDEWMLALDIPYHQAELELKHLLDIAQVGSKLK